MILVIGGTGTLGHALAEIIEKDYDGNVAILSRCELKQKEMQKLYPDFQYVVGDVRDRNWINCLKEEPQIVFNLAAMKHVDTAESNVEQCLDVNYRGVVNSFDFAITSGATNYIFTSTDKAVLPINAYGYSKALAEKYLQSMDHMDITVAIMRWGNVVNSRGSVIHWFKKSLEESNTLYITDERMTRFWANIEDIAGFMWEKHDEHSGLEPFIPPMKASTVIDLGRATAKVLGYDDYSTVFTGIRPGEKVHECLRTGHDFCLTSENCEQYTFDELCELVERSL